MRCWRTCCILIVVVLQDCKIKDLSEMLEEAAETFQEKEGEIARLKAAIEEDDEKLQQQVGGSLAISVPVSLYWWWSSCICVILLSLLC